MVGILQVHDALRLDCLGEFHCVLIGCAVKRRTFGNYVEFQKLIRPFSVMIYVEIERQVSVSWMEQFANKKKENGQSDAYYVQIIKTIRHLKLYRGDRITMKDVTKDYATGSRLVECRPTATL